MDNDDLKQYAVALCEYCDSKLNCGKMLKIFTKNMNITEAANFIRDIVKSNVFKDLKGSIDEFYIELNSDEIVEKLNKMINDNNEFDSSDEDNLRFLLSIYIPSKIIFNFIF
jgi:hypothetical protein